MSFAETWARVEPVLSQVPVTRVYDVGAIDYLKLPVWAAVTPLAKDLTVHSGKGTSPDAARLSAVMEAIERVSAEDVPPERTCCASYLELADAGEFLPIDPMLCDLPFDSAYAPDRSLHWVVAYDLMSQKHKWVARDLVISPADEGVCRGVETNGLASGNSVLEATLHAVLEVIERDASSQEDYYNANHDPAEDERPLWIVDPASLPEVPRAWYDQLTDSRLVVSLQDITSDLDVPVYCATIADPDFPGADGEISLFDGCGADEDPERAAVRALTEATQAHSVAMLGARDAFEGLTDRLRAATVARQADRVFAPPTVRWSGRALAPPPRDLAGALTRILARLDAANFPHCLVADMTRPDLGIPVVRVLIPGLAPPYGESTRRPGRRLFATLT